MEKVSLEVMVKYSELATLAEGDSDTVEVEVQDKTSSKNIVNVFKESGFKTAARYASEASASAEGGMGMGISCKASTKTSVEASVEAAFKSSCSTTNEHGKESSYRRKHTREYKGEKGKIKYVLLQSFSVGATTIKSQVVIKYDVEGEKLRDSISQMTLDCEIKPPFFYLMNNNGQYLAVCGNELKKGEGSICVYSKTCESGQQWQWEGSHLRSKLGAYLAVACDSGKSGALVIVYPRTSEQGQQWEFKKNGCLQSGKGFYLASTKQGGLIVDGKGQKWSQTYDE